MEKPVNTSLPDVHQIILLSILILSFIFCVIMKCQMKTTLFKFLQCIFLFKLLKCNNHIFVNIHLTAIIHNTISKA